MDVGTCSKIKKHKVPFLKSIKNKHPVCYFKYLFKLSTFHQRKVVTVLLLNGFTFFETCQVAFKSRVFANLTSMCTV